MSTIHSGIHAVRDRGECYITCRDRSLERDRYRDRAIYRDRDRGLSFAVILDPYGYTLLGKWIGTSGTGTGSGTGN